jgi:hypothetical protein
VDRPAGCLTGDDRMAGAARRVGEDGVDGATSTVLDLAGID